MDPLRIGVIGISGFALQHLKVVAALQERGRVQLCALVVKTPYVTALDEAARAAAFREQGIRVYDSVDAMLAAERSRLDIVCIPTGIDSHAPLAVAALHAGFHVWCEKPAAGYPDAARQMAAAQAESGKALVIGYQFMFTPMIARIKQLVVDGAYGRLVHAKTKVAWPRPHSYYARNGWAGRRSVNGVVINDSPLQNAVSHFLQNMLYVAGSTPHTTAQPRSVYGENYRANNIESADTQFIRVVTTDAVTIEMVASHAVEVSRPSDISLTEYQFERAVVRWRNNGSGEIVLPDGTTAEALSDGEEPVHNRPLSALCDYLDALRSDKPGTVPRTVPAAASDASLSTPLAPVGSIANCVAHALVIDAAYRSSGGVLPVAPDYVVTKEIGSAGAPADRITLIPDLEATIDRMFDRNCSFAEAGAAWARPSIVVTLA